MIGRQDIVVDAAGLGCEAVGEDAQLRDDIDQRADAALQLQEFVEHHYFSLFEDTVAALKVTPFIAYDVTGLVQDAFDLIQSSLCELHVSQSYYITVRPRRCRRLFYPQCIRRCGKKPSRTLSGHPDHGDDHFFEADAAMLKSIPIIIHIIIVVIGIAEKAVTAGEDKRRVDGRRG